MTIRIRLGASDWLWPSWETRFYPADMPEEWRLAFYSSQYACVFLAQDKWRSASVGEMSQWCDDVHSQFRFLLADGENSTVPDALGHKAILLGIDDPRLVWFNRNSDLKELAARIRLLPADEECFLVSSDDDLGQLEKVATLLELMDR